MSKTFPQRRQTHREVVFVCEEISWSVCYSGCTAQQQRDVLLKRKWEWGEGEGKGDCEAAGKGKGKSKGEGKKKGKGVCKGKGEDKG